MEGQFIPPYFIFKGGIEGMGVFVTQAIRKGDVIFTMKGDIISAPTRTSVQIGKEKHIEDLIASHINHHCEPNAKVNRRLTSFVATRDINVGEEITFDYTKNEDQMAEPFICSCCGNHIAGKKKTVPVFP